MTCASRNWCSFREILALKEFGEQARQDYSSICVYIYGIVDGRTAQVITHSVVGGRGDPVECVCFRDITAVISLTPFFEYDPILLFDSKFIQSSLF